MLHRRVVVVVLVLAVSLGGFIAAVPSHAAVPAAIDIFIGESANPTTQAARPWDAWRGSLATAYATGLPGDAIRAAAEGTNAFVQLPRFAAYDGRTGRPTESGGSVYAWLSCARPASLTPNGIFNEQYCEVVQPHPAGAVRIVADGRGKVIPVGDTWRVTPPGQDVLGMSVTMLLRPEMIGRYVGIRYAVRSTRDGVETDTDAGTSTPLLVMPANISVTSPSVVRAAIAGGQWVGRSTAWGPMPAGTALLNSETTAWICSLPQAATDTDPNWGVRNGCTAVEAATGPGQALSGALPANSVGKYLIVNNVIRAQRPGAAAWENPISPAWTNRSPAALIRAAGDAPPPAADVAPAGPDAAPAGPAADAEPAAPAANATPVAALPASGSPAAAAVGAGIDLGVAPIADASGRGTGASAALTMQLAASSKVKAGRFVTMKAVVGPKRSAGSVRLVFVRFNAKGQPIASKAIFAPLRKGVAKKRWRVPSTYTPSSYTLVATYVPAVPGSPGVTRTAAVSILPR